MMKYYCLFFFILFSCYCNGQKILKGVVSDEQKKPIPGASVFLSNTSIGTSADGKGNFELSLPNGKYDLIVSSIGYETYSQTITTSTLNDFISIILKPKSEQMETVVIEPFEKDGWEKWGKFFLESFIGTSAYVHQCNLKNSKAIRFRNSKKNNELTAMALEPLIIENKALGYRIKYQLETFSYNFKNHYLIYEGFPFFEPMQGGKGKQKRWEKNRRTVFYGSIMHFMRTVYRNKLSEEGFEIRSLQKVPNIEKQRVKAIYAKRFSTTSGPHTAKTIDGTDSKDSTAYYEKILAQKDYFDVIGQHLLPGDSIAYAIDSTLAGMEFNNYLLVIYSKGEAPVEYSQQFPKSSTAMMSEIQLINHRPVEIQANGSYYYPTDLFSSGYWAWSEKIATMLPFDYEVQ